MALYTTYMLPWLHGHGSIVDVASDPSGDDARNDQHRPRCPIKAYHLLMWPLILLVMMHVMTSTVRNADCRGHLLIPRQVAWRRHSPTTGRAPPSDIIVGRRSQVVDGCCRDLTNSRGLC